MKKLAVFVAIVCMTLSLAACGAQKNDLDIGQTMVKKGDCAGAAPYLEKTIAQPDALLDLALAYFLKGKCADTAGDVAGAYENFYAAKIVACYSVAHDEHINLNTYGRSEYCERILPEMLKRLEPKLGKEKADAIRTKVDTVLNARYLERFYKPTN